MLLREAAAQREWNVAQTLFPASQRRALGPSETCSLVCIANHQDPRWCWWILLLLFIFTKCDPATKCIRAVPELWEYRPTSGWYKMPNQLYGISISDYQKPWFPTKCSRPRIWFTTKPYALEHLYRTQAHVFCSCNSNEYLSTTSVHWFHTAPTCSRWWASRAGSWSAKIRCMETWDAIGMLLHVVGTNVCANLSMMTMTGDYPFSNFIVSIPFHHVNVSGMLLPTCEKIHVSCHVHVIEQYVSAKVNIMGSLGQKVDETLQTCRRSQLSVGS